MANIGPTTTEMPTNQVSVYPKHMAYFCKRLNGFSKNTVRLNTQSANTVNQNGVISITLPSNSIVDMKSLAMFFECLPSAIETAGGAVADAVYPRFTTSLIERIQVSVGGVAVGNAPNMNSAIAYLKQIATLSNDKADAQPSLWSSPQGYGYSAANGCYRGATSTPAGSTSGANFQRGVQQVVPITNIAAPAGAVRLTPLLGNIGGVGDEDKGGVPLCGSYPPASAANGRQNPQYCVELFNGFISESQPAYLDTSALGAIRMDILLSPASIFMGMGKTAGGNLLAGQAPGQVNSYTLSNIFCYVDVISVADGIYNSALAAYLAQGQSLKIPFTNYFNFVDSIPSGGFNTSLRVNVRSQNIRRVWNSWRASNFNAGNQGVNALNRANTTPYFHFGGDAGNANFGSIQLQINNVQVPSQPARAGTEVAYYNRKSLNKMNNQLGAALADSAVVQDGATNQVDMFYSCLGLDDRLSNGLRTLSGYSSAGTQTSIYVNLTARPGVGAVNEPLQHLCIVECVSMLLVGQNRQITVIS